MPARSVRRAGYVVSGMSGFYDGIGMPDPPLVAPVIEAYCLVGLRARASSTKGTYRSVLRNLSGDGRPPLATPFPGARAKAGYSAAEQAELWSVARLQANGFRVHSAHAVLSLSLGAGLRSGEVARARRGDVVVLPGGDVRLRVTGRLERLVPVSGQPASWLARASRGDREGYLFHPEEANRRYPNFVNDFCRRLVRDVGSPFLSVARCRSSFVCRHLESGTPLGQVLSLTGIAEVESLIYYSRLVDGAPHTKAALRKALAQR